MSGLTGDKLSVTAERFKLEIPKQSDQKMFGTVLHISKAKTVTVASRKAADL